MRDWRITLIESHPQLFHAPEGKPALARAYPKCGDGWGDLLERACKRIEAALAKGDTFIAREISQRLGTLRFYWSGELRLLSRPLVTDAVCRAEARSHCTCEDCGQLGYLYRAEGVLITRCIVHARGILVPIEPGFENAHLVQQVVGGHTQVVACRYDRATDAFLAIRPASHSEDGMSGRCFRDVTAPSSGIPWPGCTIQHLPHWASQRRNYSRA